MRALAACLLLAVVACGEENAEVAPGPVEQACAELSARVEALLGPKFERAVPIRMVDEEFIVGFAEEMGRRQVPAEYRRIVDRLFERYRFAPAGFDVMAAERELLRRQVAGLYDPDADCFYIVRGKAHPGTPGFNITVAHELVHAYRDIDKDYWARMMKYAREDEDRAIAVSCLAEGDAALLGSVLGQSENPAEMLPMFVARAKGASRLIPDAVTDDSRMSGIPFYLREMQFGRYFIGQEFAARLVEHGGLEGLARAYDDPPVSTEQILHPGKYLGPAVDRPTRIEGGDPAAALGEGWRTVVGNTAGEFALRVHFTELLGRKRAAEAASGWDGCRYFVCEREGAPLCIAAVSVWDSPKDASEFARAWADWATRRDRPEEADAGEIEEAAEYRVRTEGGLVVVRVDGAKAYLADGVPPDKVDAVHKALAAAKLIP